jgi:FKBP-type peptidyl-prolyl cis-trans isomerase FkpA
MRVTLIIAVAFATLLLAGCQEEKKVTPGGYEYIVHEETGGEAPNPGDYVYFHAQMRNQDSVLYASRDYGQEPFLQIPATEDPARTPSPVEEVLRFMSVGDSVTVIINLDTIPNKPPGFEDASEMYYDVVLTEIKNQETFQQDAAAEREKQRMEREAAQARLPEITEQVNQVVADYGSGALEDQLQTTDSGLKYMITEEGTGEQATTGDLVRVHYYGVLPDGTMFDNSFSKGSPFAFTLGQGAVIEGWDQGLTNLKEGGKGFLFIPSELGYGEAGSPPVIPGGSELIFYVELEEVN